MSEDFKHRTDRDLMIETCTDVRWIKSKIVDIEKDSKDTRNDVEGIKKKVWVFSGGLTVVVALWEIFKNKLFKP